MFLYTQCGCAYIFFFFFFFCYCCYLFFLKKKEKPGMYFFFFFFLNSLCVCVWHPFPSRWLRSVLSRFTPTVDQSETSKGEGTEWRRAARSLPLLHRVVVVGLLFAIGRRRHWRRLLRVQKREHDNLVLSHPPVITWRESRSSLCQNVGGRGLPSKSFAIARILTSKHNTTTNLLPSTLTHIHLPVPTRAFIYSRAIVSPARTHFHKI